MPSSEIPWGHFAKADHTHRTASSGRRTTGPLHGLQGIGGRTPAAVAKRRAGSAVQRSIVPPLSGPSTSSVSRLPACQATAAENTAIDATPLLTGKFCPQILLSESSFTPPQQNLWVHFGSGR